VPAVVSERLGVLLERLVPFVQTLQRRVALDLERSDDSEIDGAVLYFTYRHGIFTSD
jgi:hypothetical protein